MEVGRVGSLECDHIASFDTDLRTASIFACNSNDLLCAAVNLIGNRVGSIVEEGDAAVLNGQRQRCAERGRRLDYVACRIVFYYAGCHESCYHHQHHRCQHHE